MAMYAVSGEELTGIADAIRSKTGSDEQMPVSAMATAIEGISGGGGWDAEGTITKTQTSNMSTLITHNLNLSDTDIVLAYITDGVFPIGGSKFALQLCSKTPFMPYDRYGIVCTVLNTSGANQSLSLTSIDTSGQVGSSNGVLYWPNNNSFAFGRGSYGSLNAGTYHWYAKIINK